MTTSARLCVHCSYRPVRPRLKGGPACKFCSDRCEEAHTHARDASTRRQLFNQLRAMLSLPEGGPTPGNAELRRMIATLEQRLEIPDQGHHRGRRKVWGPHGTQLRYKQGCRCAECRKAEAAYRRDLRARRKVDQIHRCPPFVHCQSDLSPLATPQADRQSWDDPTPESQVA